MLPLCIGHIQLLQWTVLEAPTFFTSISAGKNIHNADVCSTLAAACRTFIITFSHFWIIGQLNRWQFKGSLKQFWIVNLEPKVTEWQITLGNLFNCHRYGETWIIFLLFKWKLVLCVTSVRTSELAKSQDRTNRMDRILFWTKMMLSIPKLDCVLKFILAPDTFWCSLCLRTTILKPTWYLLCGWYY